MGQGASTGHNVSDRQIRSQVDQLRNKFEAPLYIQQRYDLRGVTPYHAIGPQIIERKIEGSLYDSLQQNAWVNLVGIVGSGKTMLATAIQQKFQHQYWIDLKQFPIELVPGLLLEELCAHFSPQYSNSSSFSQLAGAFGENSLIVLDDFPRVDSGRNTHVFLNDLRLFLAQSGVKLLTTSNYEVAPRLGFLPQTEGIADCKLALFEDREIQALATVFDCRVEQLGLFTNVIAISSEGQPALVNALCKYFQGHNWVLENVDLDSLSSGGYDPNLQEQTLEKVLGDVPDQATRTMLYRLRLIIGWFSNPQVDIVCEAAPSIELPYEKMTALAGKWILRDRRDSYALSPLVSRLAGDNIAPALRSAINEKLGRQIIRNRAISLFDAQKALTYFERSKRDDLAGFVLSLALEYLNEHPDAFPDIPFILFWTKGPIPSGVDLHLQAVIRTIQITLLKKRNDWLTEFHLDFLISDLEAIVERAVKNAVDVSYPSLFLALHFSGSSDFSRNNRYLVTALRYAHKIEDPEFSRIIASSRFSLESFFWRNLTSVNSIDQFRSWLSDFNDLTAEQRRNSLEGDIHVACCQMFFKMLYERQSGSENPDWTLLMGFVDQILDESRNKGVPILVAYGVKTRILTLVKHFNDTGTATEFANHYLQNPVLSDMERFIVCNEIGQQLYYNGEQGAATEFLLTAAELSVPNYFTEQAEIYLILNQLYGGSDKSTAHTFAEKAFEFQVDNSFVDELFSCKIIGEYAVSVWEKDQSTNTFYIMDAGMRRILSSYKGTDEFKAMVVRYSHVINYYYHKFIRKPLPPAEGEEYVPPFRGIFLRSNTQLLAGDFYFEQRRFMAAYLMTQIFEVLEDENSARYWFEECRRLNQDDKDNRFAILMLGLHVHLILDEKYEEAGYFVLQLHEQINELSSRFQHQAASGQDELARKMSMLGSAVPDDADLVLNYFVALPVILKLLTDYLHNGDLQQMGRRIERFEKIRPCFASESSMIDLAEVFGVFSNPDSIFSDLINLVAGQPDSIQTIVVYWFASLKGNAVEAYRSQIATVRAFLTVVSRSPSEALLRLVVRPFFVEFWKQKFQLQPEAFDNRAHLTDKGWPAIASEKGVAGLRKLFQVMAYHLNQEFDENYFV
ncbi:hypothetical protein [Dyadobacter sp. 22481]|uniref:hypothetical protein n=1 Tax=Dyadobacter sp. 22481 TaxID=3453926 RepID=UPI003F82DAE5